jgi:hypothetical protein
MKSTLSLPTIHRLGLATLRFLILWGLVWAVQWVWAPRWLVGSRAGLSTVFQTLPGVLVALFALIVASLYILGQQVSGAYGHRSIAVLITDSEAGALLIRALILSALPLIVSGQVPDEGRPAAWVTALTASALLATGTLIVRATNTLSGLLGAYTAPRSFVERMIKWVFFDMAMGALGEVVYKVTALTEMLRTGIRRGELNTVEAAVFGLDSISDMYLKIAEKDPSVRTFQLPHGVTREGWLGQDLASGLTAAGEEALAHGTQEDGNLLARWAEARSRSFVAAGLEKESHYLIDAHIALGTSPRQVTPQTINLWPQAAGALAVMERAAEENGMDEIATEVLAGWALVTAYPEIQWGRPHPSKQYSLAYFGPNPPWRDATTLVQSVEWQRTWTNKVPSGFKPLEDLLTWASRQLAPKSP